MITPNIIVTKRFDTMKRIFFGPNSLGDARANTLSRVLEEVGEEDGLLICAPGRNQSLMEADLNIPQGGVGKGYLNLKFVETKSILEYFLLDLSPLETNFNTVYNLVDRANVAVDELLERVNKYYISFGTGDNLDEWAGPFECSLGSAQVQLDNNVKSITLGFLMGSLEGIRGYTKKLYGNLGFGTVDKLNPVLPKGTTVSLSSRNVNLDAGLDITKGPLIKFNEIKRKRCLLPPRGWNTYIRRVLQNYLGNLYGDPFRVMVILGDDMDKIFNSGLVNSNKALDFMRNYQGKLKEFGIKLRLKEPNLKTKNKDISSDSTQYKSAVFQAPGGKEIFKSSLQGGAFQDELGNSKTLDGRFNVEDELRTIRQVVSSKKKAYEEFDTYSERQGNSQAIKEKMTQYKDLYDDAFLLTECFLRMSTSLEVGADGTTPKTLLDPIFDFIGALRKYQEKPTEYALFELNDVEINDLINENIARPDLKRKSRLVFGDVDLIKKLIYLADDGAKPLTQSAYKFTFSLDTLDRINWERYQEQFKNTILKRERRQTSSFKEQLDFGPFTREFKEIEDKKDIIFLHGVKNSNVQSVSFRKDLAQGALLNFALKARKRAPFMNNFLKLAVVNDKFKVEEAIEYLEQFDIFVDDVNLSRLNLLKFIEEGEKSGSRGVKHFKLLLSRSDSNITSQGLESKKERFLDLIDLIIGYREILRALREDGLDADVAYLNDANTDNNTILRRYVDLQEKAQKLIVQINVKTLPFFNQKNYFGRRCYFFSQYNNIISRSLEDKDKIPSTLLNGSYQILGARHYISSEDAFSEFVLVKDGLGDDPILESTRKLLGEAASVVNPKNEKTDPAINTPGAKRLPEKNKRQEISKQLKAKSQSTFEEVQIVDEFEQPQPGTIVE